MREIKFEYGFTNHAPVVLTLSQIEHGALDHVGQGEAGKIKFRRPYTGRKDQHGEELYEGDIVYVDVSDKNMPPFNTVIGWHESSFTAPQGHNYYNLQFWPEDCLTRIGNIYQHPELLTA